MYLPLIRTWLPQAGLAAEADDLADKTGGPIAPTRPAPPAGQWFDLDVIAAGPTVRVLVNGQETSRADRRPPGPGGRIALQAFGGTTEVEFASIAVKELPAGKSPE